MENQELFIHKKSELISLIKNSKMSNKEKEAWLNLIPEMAENEIKEFIQILKNEINVSQKLKEKYQEKIHRIKMDFNQKWNEFIQNTKTKINQADKIRIQQKEQEELIKLRQELK